MKQTAQARLEKEKEILDLVKDLTDERAVVRKAAGKIIRQDYYFQDALPLLLQIISDFQLNGKRGETRVILKEKFIELPAEKRTEALKELLYEEIEGDYSYLALVEDAKILLGYLTSQQKVKLMKELIENLVDRGGKLTRDIKEILAELLPKEWKEEELVKFLLKYQNHSDRYVRVAVTSFLPLTPHTVNVFLEKIENDFDPVDYTAIERLIRNKLGREQLKKFLFEKKKATLFQKIARIDPEFLREIEVTEDKKIKKMIRKALNV